jgi:hypothetical protein
VCPPAVTAATPTGALMAPATNVLTSATPVHFHQVLWHALQVVVKLNMPLAKTESATSVQIDALNVAILHLERLNVHTTSAKLVLLTKPLTSRAQPALRTVMSAMWIRMKLSSALCARLSL